MSNFIDDILKFVERMIDRKTQNIMCVLGTITQSGGVKLDNHKEEIKNPLYLEWTIDITLKSGAIKGTIMPGLNAGTNPVVGKFNFPADIKAEVKDITSTTKKKYVPGDRVLCIPVGGDIVIIGKVVR
jgi:hypothetical protein